MNLYSVEIQLCATAYIKAKSPEEAFYMAQGLGKLDLELAEDHCAEVPISGQHYDDEDLPPISLSPCMTIYGPWPGSTTADLAE